MKVIRTELSVRRINAKMRNRGFTSRKSELSSAILIYVKDNARVMYVFERKIKANLSF